MNIGIDARFYRKNTAGLGRYTRGLLHELVKIDNKNNYTIFIAKDDNAEYDITAANFTKVIVPVTHYTLKEQLDFCAILNNYRFDLVHFLNFNHPVLYRRPFIATIHDLTMLLFPVGRSQKSLLRKIAFRMVMKNAVKNSKYAIAVSQATKNDCVKYLHANKNKIKVIYEAYDKIYHPNYSASEIDKILAKYQIVKPYLLFVSQWRPHKGLPELIKVFDLLKEKYHLKHKLVITGKPNKDFLNIANSIKKAKYSDDIVTPGFVDEIDLPLLYKGSTAFIFPSFYEGFGLGGLEAMACGTPVISSNQSSLPEIFGDAAVYFNPNDINAMAKTIFNTISNQSLLDKMCENGIKKSKGYSWQKMAEETLSLYKKTEER